MSDDLLRRAVHEVRSLALADETAFTAGGLTLSASRAAQLLADPALATVNVSVVSPGESARILKVLDAVEPRTKGRGGGGIFPGILGPARPQGSGETHVLRGASVVLAGYLPRAQEALVDMSGPAAPLAPLAQTHNVVIEFEKAGDASWQDVDTALRRGALRLAVHLADAALDSPPDAVEELRASDGSGPEQLPRVGTITNLQTQGAFKDVFLYGRSLSAGLPTLVDARELDDGAVVCGQYGHPGLRNPTHLHQSNPVVAELRARDGVDLRFGGVILSPEPVDQAQKELVCAHAARLAKLLGWDAGIVTKEGGGNADSDMALKMDAMERLGVVAVGVYAEMSGRDGEGPPIVVAPERATAMVSTGNYDERLRLPAVERALGGERVEVAGAGATEEVEVPTAVILGSLSPLGWGRLTASDAVAVA